MRHLRLPAAAALMLSAVATPAFGGTVGFSCITNNVVSDCTIGAAQLSLDVVSEGSGQVRLTFSNAGPQDAVISEIYIDDEGRLFTGIASIVNGTGVLFEPGASPPKLPGRQLASPDFEVTADLLAQAAPAPPKNGVGEGESVSIIFNLRAGTSFSDVLTRFGDGTLRAGLHVIAFASGGSESFVSEPVPEPSAALLVLAGLAGVALRRPGRSR